MTIRPGKLTDSIVVVDMTFGTAKSLLWIFSCSVLQTGSWFSWRLSIRNLSLNFSLYLVNSHPERGLTTAQSLLRMNREKVDLQGIPLHKWWLNTTSRARVKLLVLLGRRKGACFGFTELFACLVLWNSTTPYLPLQGKIVFYSTGL